MASWADKSRKVIVETIAKCGQNATHEEIKKAVKDAYPFGPREYHPYKMWCKVQHEELAKRGIVPPKKRDDGPQAQLLSIDPNASRADIDAMLKPRKTIAR